MIRVIRAPPGVSKYIIGPTYDREQGLVANRSSQLDFGGGAEIVRVEHLTYEYPGVRALDDVSFTVPRGSVTALVGPNGAGKTTLLRCMAALDVPMDGEIVIADVDVLENPRECHRHIGYLSDFFGVY